MKTITYSQIRDAAGDAYPMTLTGTDEIAALVKAVNAGIDSHLEACFAPNEGDTYTPGVRRIGTDGPIIARTMECRVSPKSLPTLIRRLVELGEAGDEAADDLANGILASLDIDVMAGCFEVVNETIDAAA